MRPSITRAGRQLLPLALVALMAGCGESTTTTPATESTSAQPASAPQAASESGADQAWAKFEHLVTNPPPIPEAWASEPPDEEAVEAFSRVRGESAEAVANAARDFYTGFPDDPRANAARSHELDFLNTAVQLGHTNVISRLEALEKARFDDPATTEDQRLELRMSAAQRKASLLFPQGERVARAAFSEAMRDLAREFPHRPEPYQILLNLAGSEPPETARETASTLLSTNVPAEVRASAQALLDKLNRIGKPLELKFAALDGKEIDIADFRGKVVLIDFWATWCGPCIASLPQLKAVYSEFHPKGLEIIGISFDQEKEALETFIKRENMPWPQYFDGEGWANAIGRRFGIEGIPEMWLVDKTGILRDVNARDDLERKIADLLAETPPETAN